MGSVHTHPIPESPVCSSWLIFLPRDQRGTGCNWNGDGKRLCPGWSRDLILLLEITSSHFCPNHPQCDHPAPTPPPTGLGCPCPLKVTWGQVLSSPEMFRALAVPDRTPGDAGAQHALTNPP